MSGDVVASEAGFTLVEVLVALVVSALLLLVILDGAVAARARAVKIAARQEATLLAQGLIEQARAAPYSEEPKSGSEDGLTWQTSETIALADPRGLYALIKMRAQINDSDGRALVEFETRKLKALAPQ